MLIVDIGDGNLLKKIAKARKKLVLTGRSVQFFNLLSTDGVDIILCEECSKGIDYPRKITYAGQAELLKEGDAKILIEVDRESIGKVLTYLTLIRNLMMDNVAGATSDRSATNTDIGELWCAEKHLEMAFVAVVEVIEKAIREGLEADTLVEIHSELRELLTEFDGLASNPSFQSSCSLIDKIRRLRAKAGLWRVRNRAVASPALKEDFRKITSNLAHAEDHLVQFLAQLKAGSECITCEEDRET